MTSRDIERIDPEPICMCRFDADCPDHGRPEFRRSQPASEPSLDVERLARALGSRSLSLGVPPSPSSSLTRRREYARNLAAEYARLSQPTEPSETDQE